MSPPPTASTGPAGPVDHRRTAELLDAELPALRFRDGTFLEWLYDENPLGPGIHESIDDEGVRVAHYGLIPQEYRSQEGPAPFVFSLNAVTRSGLQRKGYFSQIGQRIWAEAAERGVIGVVGVTNDRSLKPVVRLGWRFIGRLPVLVVPPSPATRPPAPWATSTPTRRSAGRTAGPSSTSGGGWPGPAAARTTCTCPPRSWP